MTSVASAPTAGELNLPESPACFLTTRWSVVLAAKDKASPGSTEALETLCRTYWRPLYAYVRGSGHTPEDAQDLTQEFFARLLAKDYLRVVVPEKGRFRTFLRMALQRFLANEWDRVRAQKRGGGQALLSFDTAMAESWLGAERAGTAAPDRLYERRWALTLLADVLARLERAYVDAGKGPEFACLEPRLTADRGSIPYAEVASALGTTEGAARVAVHRLRGRFREVFRETIADTVAVPEEVEDEMRHVLAVLSDV
jgi:RNA polymerase sigma-70 factor (ECF subfamily)